MHLKGATARELARLALALVKLLFSPDNDIPQSTSLRQDDAGDEMQVQHQWNGTC